MKARLTIARDANGEVLTRTTTKPAPDGLGGTFGGQTVRLFPMKSESRKGQVKYNYMPLEPKDTVISQILFDVEVGGESYESITKRELNKLLGNRQMRKAMRSMSDEDRGEYRNWRLGKRAVSP